LPSPSPPSPPSASASASPSTAIPSPAIPSQIQLLHQLHPQHLEEELPHLGQLRRVLLEAVEVILGQDEEPLLPPATRVLKVQQLFVSRFLGF
jgi:hypothetical protein